MRSVVRELKADERYVLRDYVESELPGRPFPLVPADISQNDVSKFLSSTQT